MEQICTVYQLEGLRSAAMILLKLELKCNECNHDLLPVLLLLTLRVAYPLS